MLQGKTGPGEGKGTTLLCVGKRCWAVWRLMVPNEEKRKTVSYSLIKQGSKILIVVDVGWYNGKFIINSVTKFVSCVKQLSKETFHQLRPWEFVQQTGTRFRQPTHFCIGDAGRALVIGAESLLPKQASLETPSSWAGKRDPRKGEELCAPFSSSLLEPSDITVCGRVRECTENRRKKKRECMKLGQGYQWPYQPESFSREMQKVQPRLKEFFFIWFEKEFEKTLDRRSRRRLLSNEVWFWQVRLSLQKVVQVEVLSVCCEKDRMGLK